MRPGYKGMGIKRHTIKVVNTASLKILVSIFNSPDLYTSFASNEAGMFVAIKINKKQAEECYD